MCGDDRIYFEKEDYADYNDPDNWDIISPYVALTRGDRRGLYNPLVESEYVYGATPWDYQEPVIHHPRIRYGILVQDLETTQIFSVAGLVGVTLVVQKI